MNAKTPEVSLFLRIIGAVLILQFSVPGFAAEFSSKTVQFSWFYKPPYGATLDKLSKNFDNYILTKGDEQSREYLKDRVATPILQYVRLDAIQDPGSCSRQPYRNQVAYQPGDFCRISKDHPDWFLLDHGGKRLYDKQYDGYVMMDPGNTGWRSFFLSRLKQMQNEGWHGAFLDNIEGSLAKKRQFGQMPRNYNSDGKYQVAVTGFLKLLYNSYFKPQHRALLGNIICLRSSSTWFRYLRYLDGAMDEAWAVGWHNDYVSKDIWLSSLDMAAKTQQMEKHAILVSQGSRGNDRLQQFAYASYLLIANGKASFRYTDNSSYRYAWIYNNYHIRLGEPLGARYKKDQSYCRDFARGRVCVNPVTHASKITKW